MTGNQRDLQELLRLIREEIGTPEVLAQLHRLIASDRQVMHDYIREMHLQASLNWLLDGQVPGGSAVRSEVRRQIWARRRKWVWRSVSTVIVLSVVAALGMMGTLRTSVRDRDVPPVVASIDSAHGPRWIGPFRGDDGALVRVGHGLEISAGLVRVRFENGASVTLEGPARCRIEGAGRVRLTSGRLLAHVPSSAIGFTVQTPVAQAIDLGTQFGVVVGSDGAPEFHVLEGTIRAQNDRLPPELLTADQASRYAVDGKTRQSIPAANESFNTCLQLSAGITAIMGQAQFSNQAAATRDAVGLTRPDVVHVLRERRGLVLPQALSVLAAEPGSLDPAEPPEMVELAAGTVVDAYMLHLESIKGISAKCQLTFARPIRGLLVDPQSLNQTDDLLCIPGFRYLPPGRDANTRGALFPAAGLKESGDSLALSADRRTLILQLQAGANYIDQIRVLVSSEAEPQSANSP